MNYLAILAGAVVPMILGAIWYHPKVLGSIWMNATGLTEEDTKGGNPINYLGALVLAGVLAYRMSMSVSHPDPLHPMLHGMFHGGVYAGLYIAVPVIGLLSIFEKRSLSYFLVNAAYWAFTLAVMSGVLAMFLQPAS